MSLLKSIQNPTTPVAGETDRLGSYLLDTDAYDLTVTLAYLIKAKSGATGVVLEFKTAEGKKISTTQYITSGTAKGCKTYYEKDGKQFFLPGYILVDSLCQLTVGKSILQMDEETKVFNIYDSTQQKEVPTQVPALVELFGQKVTAGVVKQVVNKYANGAITNEKREENDIVKFFQIDTGLTVPELIAKETKGAFLPKWVEENSGKVFNKFKEVQGAPTPGAGIASGELSGLFA